MTQDERPIRSLSEWRKRLPMTQAELAKKAHVSLAALRTWEQGKNRPRPAAHRSIAKALGIEPGQITFGKADADATPNEAIAPAA